MSRHEKSDIWMFPLWIANAIGVVLVIRVSLIATRAGIDLFYLVDRSNL